MSELGQLYRNMYGGKKYTENDIVRGRKPLRNGAVAGYVMKDGKEVWRIVNSKDVSMKDLRGFKSRYKLGELDRKQITKRQAVIAFNKAYKNKGPRSKSYDRNHYGERGEVVSDRRYLRSPYEYDFEGVDAGPTMNVAKNVNEMGNIIPRRRSAKQRKNDIEFGVRASTRAGFAALPSSDAMSGGAVDLKTAVNLLRSYYDDKYN